MTANDALAGAGSGLERRYRRLLLAYPRSYRRSHGAEILTTLMDAAGPSRDRPTRREVRDLMLGGLRQHFRLPVGRLAVFVAVVSALVLGALGAAAGSGLGWATGRALPDDAGVDTVVGVIAGEPARWNATRTSDAFGLRPQAVVALATPVGSTVPGAEAARSRLAAEGWRVGPVVTTQTAVWTDGGVTIRANDYAFVAERDGLQMMVSVLEGGFAPGPVSVMMHSAEPRSVLPLTIAGLVAGLLAGWLLVARVGYRVRRLGALRRVPHLVAAVVAGCALGVPAPAVYRAAVEAVVAGPAPARPGQFGRIPVFAVHHIDSPLDPYTLTGLGALVLLVALAYAVPPKPAPDPAATA
ncbi:hypothetical protein [Virgisporangium ochraceum]|uniref:Uncharacterized protein n=1 Tax=Virgisporangium ochraceum TaxID=65505 RepID=A0A8J4EJH6_9ACTN|nr:hypothetical protein [Virgisporangium ochraceum]GIJ74322.1 hypothetical protein Voc01_092390 [Virgisporangium ochraceum]